jgi:hypothetical protein
MSPSWLLLTKNSDEYIDRFSQGVQISPQSLENYRFDRASDAVIVLRGIMKHKLIKQFWDAAQNFVYMDSGYLGNRPCATNPQGWKLWHRMVINNIQHSRLIARPSDRWQRLALQLASRKQGRKILVVAPDQKPCKFYGIDLDQWIQDTVAEIKKHSDRPIEIRARHSNTVKLNRTHEQSFQSALQDDVGVVVTYNSVAAVESIMNGVPVVALAPVSAADPVASKSLEQVDDAVWPSEDLRYQWACHLAYAQFHNRELEDGTAARQLLQDLDQGYFAYGK